MLKWRMYDDGEKMEKQKSIASSVHLENARAVFTAFAYEYAYTTSQMPIGDALMLNLRHDFVLRLDTHAYIRSPHKVFSSYKLHQ